MVGFRDFRVINLEAIGGRRVAPDMGALPAYTSLGLTEQLEVQLTGLLSSFIAASPPRLSLRFRSSLYSGQPLAQDEAARVMGVGVIGQGDDRLFTHPRL